MSANPLVVVAPHDDGLLVGTGSAAERTDGLAAVDGGVDAADAFARGDWIEGTVCGMTASLDLAGALLDPIGTVAASIAGWLINHLGPVQDLLDQLCGDPAEIAAASATWTAVARHLAGVSDDYSAAVRTDLDGHDGLAVAAYRRFADVEATLVAAFARIADAVGAGVTVAGTLLAGVRDFISTLMAEVVGQVVKLIGESVVTVGVGAPHAFATAAKKCRDLIQRARVLVEDLARSLDRMARLVDEVTAALEAGARAATRASARSEVVGEHTRGLALDLLRSVTVSATQADDVTPYAVA